MHQLTEPLPVEEELLVLLLKPASILEDVAPSGIHLENEIRQGAQLPIDGVGQRIPRVDLPRAKTLGKEVNTDVTVLPQRRPPNLSKQMHTPIAVVEEHRRLLKIAVHKVIYRQEDLLVGAVFRGMENVEFFVALDDGCRNKREHGFGRQLMDNRQFRHPAAEILPQPHIAISRIEKTLLKRLHLGEAVRHRVGTDAVQQLIYINVCQRGGNIPPFAAPRIGAPGEVSAQLRHVQVVVSGKVVLELPVPGRVIGVVLHELPLTVEIPALRPERLVLVLVKADHLPDGLGHGVVLPFGHTDGRGDGRLAVSGDRRGRGLLGTEHNGTAGARLMLRRAESLQRV